MGQQCENIDSGHGIIESRRYTPLLVDDWFEHTKGWSNLQIIIEVVRKRYDRVTKKESIETAYFISSFVLALEKLGYIIRNHWGIENSLHFLLGGFLKKMIH